MKYYLIDKVASKTLDKVVLAVDENGVVASIPSVESNVEYQQYLAWVAEGNVAEEWQPE